MSRPYTPEPFPAKVMSMLGLQSWNAAQLRAVADAMPWKTFVDAREFGLSGRGETNEYEQFQDMLNVPDGVDVVFPMMPDGIFRVGLYQTPELRNAQGRSFRALAWHMADYAPTEYGPGQATPGVQLIWGGSAGERVLGIYDSASCRFEGFSVHGGNAGIGLDVDQTKNKRRICSTNRFIGLRVMGGVGNRNWTAVRLSAESRENVEYMTFEWFNFSGNGDLDPTQIFGDAKMTAGSNVLERTSGAFPLDCEGKRVRVGGAGTRFTRKLLDARIVRRIDNSHAQLDTIAARDVNGVRWAYDDACGTGLEIAPSFNAKRQVLRHGNIQDLSVGIRSRGGSLKLEHVNMPQNDINIWLDGNQSEQSTELDTNTENSRQHLVYQANGTYTMRDGRYALGKVCPGAAYFTALEGAQRVKMDGGSLEGGPYPDSAVWEFTPGLGVKTRDVAYPWDYTAEWMGLEDASGKDNLPNLAWFDSDDTQAGAAVFNRRRIWGDRSGRTLR